jgi:hypothetical protein
LEHAGVLAESLIPSYARILAHPGTLIQTATCSTRRAALYRTQTSVLAQPRVPSQASALSQSLALQKSAILYRARTLRDPQGLTQCLVLT